MKLPQHFLDHWLRAFEKSRVDNHQMVTSFVAQLESTLPEASWSGSGTQLDYQMGGGWRSSPDAHGNLWQTFRQAWQERRHLRTELPRTDEVGQWVVADDRRSGTIEHWNDLTSQLREFGGQDAASWMTRWRAQNQRLICFTPNLLAQRGSSPRDATHLSYLSLFAVPLAWPLTFLGAAGRMLASQPLRALSSRNAWITALLAASFDVLLNRQKPARLLMTTSNSFVIELLRYMQAVSGQGEGVTEVLHGIPSLELETYHQEMMAFAPSLLSGRLTLVPPVPGLRVNTADGHIRVATNTVNLKMNAVSRQRDLSALADECVHRRSVRATAHVVTLNGAGTVEGKHYLQTGCFAAEQAILRHVLAESRRQGVPVHLQYSLHPAHIKSGSAAAIREALAADAVEVLEDSLQTWLESDLCISVFSSASWDAFALGCDVVIGVKPEDLLYSGDMLSSFSHPTSDQTIFDVLAEAISRLPGRQHLSPHERVARITGKSENAE